MAYSAYQHMRSNGMIIDRGCYAQLMASMVTMGDGEKVLEVVKDLRQRRMLMDEALGKTIIVSLINNERSSQALSFLSMIQEEGSVTLDTYHVAIHVLGKKKQFADLDRLVTAMVKLATPINIVTYTSLVTAYGQQDTSLILFKVLDLMNKNKCAPNMTFYNIVLSVLINGKHFNDIPKLLHMMEDKGFKPDMNMYTTLIKFYANFGRSLIALEYFQKLQQEGVVADESLVNIVISQLVHENHLDEARTLFYDLEGKGVPMYESTYITLRDGIAHVKKQEAKKLDSMIEAKKLNRLGGALAIAVQKTAANTPQLRLSKLESTLVSNPNTTDRSVYKALIIGYADDEKWDKVYETYKQMRANSLPPDVVSSGITLRALVHLKRHSDALDLLNSLQKEGVSPLNILYYELLKGLAIEGYYTQFCEVQEMMKAMNVIPSKNMLDLMVETFLKHNNLPQAVGCVEILYQRRLLDDKSMISLIKAFGKRKQVNEALKIVETAEKDKLLVTEALRSALLEVLFACGEGKKAIDLFGKRYIIGSSSPTFQVMVEGLSSLGKINEALKIFKTMKKNQTPNEGVYTAIATALFRHGFDDKGMAVLAHMMWNYNMDLSDQKRKLIYDSVVSRGHCGKCIASLAQHGKIAKRTELQCSCIAYQQN
jgi:pentatricopeptide repeat protein